MPGTYSGQLPPCDLFWEFKITLPNKSFSWSTHKAKETKLWKLFLPYIGGGDYVPAEREEPKWITQMNTSKITAGFLFLFLLHLWNCYQNRLIFQGTGCRNLVYKRCLLWEKMTYWDYKWHLRKLSHKVL